MREANTVDADKYFHCMANCQAARRGKAGRYVARGISELREWVDRNIKGDPQSACEADRAANKQGIEGDLAKPCEEVCESLRPYALPRAGHGTHNSAIDHAFDLYLNNPLVTEGLTEIALFNHCSTHSDWRCEQFREKYHRIHDQGTNGSSCERLLASTIWLRLLSNSNGKARPQ
jgi:hypothetical protein